MKAVNDASKVNHKLLQVIVRKMKNYNFKGLLKSELLKIRDIAYDTYTKLNQRKKARKIVESFVDDKSL